MALQLDPTLKAWLAEDLGEPGLQGWLGDVTTAALLGEERPCRGQITAQEDCVIAGLGPVRTLFKMGGARLVVTQGEQVKDADRIAAGGTVLEMSGPARGVLAVERLALNLLAHLSGIATATARVVARARKVNPNIEVAATRKTTPGLRSLEKEAVVTGGGVAHRTGLFDAFLVKDNHLALMEGEREEQVVQAVEACRRAHPRLLLEVEADTAEQARAAARAGADWVLLDNFTPQQLDQVAQDLKKSHPTLRLEASGGITPDNVERFAPQVHRVSLGWLTQSAPASPMSLHVRPDQ